MSKTFFLLTGFIILLAFDVFSQVCFKSAALQAAPFAVTVDWLVRVLGTVWTYGAIAG